MTTIVNYIEVSNVGLLNKKRKKCFGKKIKISEWDFRNDIDIPSNLEQKSIVEYLTSKKKINFKEMMDEFKIEPCQSEKELLETILRGNPLMNIRKREKDYLLRMKLRRQKLTKKFDDLDTAKKVRNLLLYYSISNNPKFNIYLLKRAKISEANKTKFMTKKITSTSETAES